MSRYKVGDKVRVREWEDMEKEFEKGTRCITSKNGCSFREDMKELCGKTYKIESVCNALSNGTTRYRLCKCAWSFDDCMLENAEFCLDDLKDENIIELRCGEKLVILGEYFVNNNGYVKKKDYYQDFKNKNLKEWDIVAAYPPSGKTQRDLISMTTPTAEPIWKEKKRIEIPEPDRTILENINEEYKYIVRDHAGDIFVCTRKPEKHKYYWLGKEKSYPLTAFNHLFQFVQWTDEEPVNFREALKGE